MAKKSAKKKSKTPARSGELYGIRCSDEDAADFKRAAYLEGFSSPNQWLLAIGRKRSRAILQAAEDGSQITITETIVSSSR